MLANFGFISSRLNDVRANRQYLTIMMRDIEVYLGFFMIVLYFMGRGQLVGIILYW